jgi:cytochrome c-type biogenesis protein CcmE
MSQKIHKVLITGIAVLLGVGLLVWAAADAQWVQTVSAQQCIDNLAAYKGKSLQIYGKVVPGSVQEQGQAMEFELYWPDVNGNKGELLRVKYAGLRKVNLNNDADILIDCDVDDMGLVSANKILTKCPSKYKSRSSEGKK